MPAPVTDSPAPRPALVGITVGPRTYRVGCRRWASTRAARATPSRRCRRMIAPGASGVGEGSGGRGSWRPVAPRPAWPQRLPQRPGRGRDSPPRPGVKRRSRLRPEGRGLRPRCRRAHARAFGRRREAATNADLDRLAKAATRGRVTIPQRTPGAGAGPRGPRPAPPPAGPGRQGTPPPVGGRPGAARGNPKSRGAAPCVRHAWPPGAAGKARSTRALRARSASIRSRMR